MTAAGRGRRGVSLVEMVVVVFIGVVLVVSLLPSTIALLRQQRALDSTSLSIESFPLLMERMAADFARSSGADIQPPLATLAFRIVLLPRKDGGPAVTYGIRSDTVVRSVSEKDAEGHLTVASRTWTVDGGLTLLHDELLRGRTVLLYTPRKGSPEYLAFWPGRPTRRIGP